MLRLLNRITKDITTGKNIEGYVVTTVALLVAVLSIIEDVVPDDLQMAAILAALALLVFKSTQPDEKIVDLDDVLRDRQSFGSFREFIKGGTVLWVYGPSAVNVLNSSPDIEREILAKGGELRVVLQDPRETNSIAVLHNQLDQMSHLLETDITRSVAILESLKTRGYKVDYRYLPYSPGFSLVILDPDGRNGRAVVEWFGFSNKLITDRMHVKIARAESNYWFEYWESQFLTMWEAGRAPENTP